MPSTSCPTQVTMDDFVQGRVDRAILDSPQLQPLVRPVKGKEKHPDRLRVKRVSEGATGEHRLAWLSPVEALLADDRHQGHGGGQSLACHSGCAGVPSL